MVGTDRLPPRRVTALGGGVIGLSIGLLVSFLVGWAVLDQQKNAAILSEAKTRASLEGTISAMREEAEKKQRHVSGLPVLRVAQVGESNTLAIRKLMDQFPPFKTDPYKQLFADLGGLVDQQRQHSSELIAALSDASVEHDARCKVIDGQSTAAPLWAYGIMTFGKDGWRGVSP